MLYSVLAPRAVIGQSRTFPPLLVSGAHWSVSWPGTGHHWSDAATSLIGGPLTTIRTTRTLRTIGNGANLHTKDIDMQLYLKISTLLFPEKVPVHLIKISSMFRKYIRRYIL